ncbi:hypothetical protein ACTMQ1_26485 [Pseudomonas syringae pv. aptata]|uniref:hypothetical protein n=1 Tax=Pseudomonas syringae TaxID=317 RepID=UPI003F88ABE0
MKVQAEKLVWCIAITFGDEENNGFVTLGGAGWESGPATPKPSHALGRGRRGHRFGVLSNQGAYCESHYQGLLGSAADHSSLNFSACFPGD